MGLGKKTRSANDAVAPLEAAAITKKNAEAIAADLVANRKRIPGAFGRAPRDINKHHNGYKAEEWKGWALMYSVPVLDQERLPDASKRKGWRQFVCIMRRMFSYQISRGDVLDLRADCKNYVAHFGK